tara:strand:- start:102 stop:803 length:702 start_codon:yes stop_codon:yes gene_type:complete
MNIFNEIINGQGYKVLPIKNMKIFNKLRLNFFKNIGLKNKITKIDILRKKIAKMKNSEVNNLMVKLLSFNDASTQMIQACSNIVEELSGKDIFIQRRLNTIFNLPGKEQRRQWPHYELMSGISPYTFVMWAPFHDLDDEGGVYYFNQKESMKIIKYEHSKGLVNSPHILDMMNYQKPPKIKYGEVIVFNPFILHGNISFNSNLARIACSVRFQSIKKPLMQKNTDFFKYYSLR